MPLTAMILAAGVGERLRPLTLETPKPLILLGQDSAPTLIERQIRRLVKAGFDKIVINVHYLHEKIQEYLGDGTRFGVNIQYSVETDLLDTAGGIASALPLLGKSPFAVVSADVVTDFEFTQLADALSLVENPDHCMGVLVLGENPSHHPNGDFLFDATKNWLVDDEAESSQARKTFLGMAVFHPESFIDLKKGSPYPLRPCITNLIKNRLCRGITHEGVYFDCGSIERLEQARLWWKLNEGNLYVV